MADYKIIKICYHCRQKFTVMKGQSKQKLCPKCEKKAKKDSKD